jgi:nucleotide-binding universal stress UspA family protein
MTRIQILVPVNHANGRDPAFERGLALARAFDAELHLIHAVPADHNFSSGGAQRLQQWAELRKRAEAVKVTVQTIEQHGDPADIITLYADDRAVDLIVMATGRRTGWARLRQPSVAERVVRRTTRPTLVVRQDDSVAAGFRNVLAAVDLSPTSNTVIDMAMQVSEPDARRLTVIHAVESVEGTGAVRSLARWIVPEYRGYVLDDNRRRLETMMRDIDVDSTTQLRVAPGSAADAIVEHAADVNADLIVVGKSRRLMRRGATAIRVLRHSDRAILVVPQTASGRLSHAKRPSLRRAA